MRVHLWVIAFLNGSSDILLGLLLKEPFTVGDHLLDALLGYHTEDTIRVTVKVHAKMDGDGS